MRHGEIEAHDAMHRKHQRRGQTRPAAGTSSCSAANGSPTRASPARRCRRGPASSVGRERSRNVARSGIRPDVPEEQRNGEVRRNREHIPHERAAQLRPQAHRVRVRHDPVEDPRAAQVQQRKHPRAGDGEKRHRLREAVDGVAPLLEDQQQDGRDERARVADADPPDEVDDGEPPRHRDVDAPDADALCRTGR